ncbi:MAG: hypothetical protein M1821_006532 [Bathelium mastoideum]|nr:MAG: hypothetical protein M1821_006532 [Bathelium mastoideum]
MDRLQPTPEAFQQAFQQDFQQSFQRAFQEAFQQTFRQTFEQAFEQALRRAYRQAQQISDHDMLLESVNYGEDKKRAIECLNIARLQRLLQPGRGKSANKKFQPSDTQNAGKIMRENKDTPLTSLPGADRLNEDYKSCGMGRDVSTGIFEEGLQPEDGIGRYIAW